MRSPLSPRRSTPPSGPLIILFLSPFFAFPSNPLHLSLFIFLPCSPLPSLNSSSRFARFFSSSPIFFFFSLVPSASIRFPSVCAFRTLQPHGKLKNGAVRGDGNRIEGSFYGDPEYSARIREVSVISPQNVDKLL